MSKWRATMPKIELKEGETYVIYAMETADGGRVEYCGIIDAEISIEVFKTLANHEIEKPVDTHATTD